MATAYFRRNDGTLDYTATGSLAFGDIILVGDRVGIVPRAAGTYDPVAVITDGVFGFPKGAGAMDPGKRVFWDAGNSVAVLATGATTGMKFIGYTARAASYADTAVDVLLVAGEPYIAKSAHIADPAAAAALTQDALTDNSGGTAGTTVAAIGATYDQAEVRNAVATILAQLAKIKADVAAVRTASEANNTTIDSILAAIEAANITAAS